MIRERTVMLSRRKENDDDVDPNYNGKYCIHGSLDDEILFLVVHHDVVGGV